MVSYVCITAKSGLFYHILDLACKLLRVSRADPKPFSTAGADQEKNVGSQGKDQVKLPLADLEGGPSRLHPPPLWATD